MFDGSVPGTVLLLHAGIADHAMWQPQIEPLEAAGYRVLAPDLLGYGSRPLGPGSFSNLRDAARLLDGPAAVVGCSLGGRVALELAVERPELVERLVVIAPGLPGWSWSEDVRECWAAEESAFRRGDFAAAAEAVVRLWVDGPKRSPGDVEPGFRGAVRAMTLRSYEMQRDANDAVEEAPPGGSVAGRLGEVRAPTLVLVGDEDVADMQAIAAHVAASIAGARFATIHGASHLPPLERPAETNAHILPFLDGH